MTLDNIQRKTAAQLSSIHTNARTHTKEKSSQGNKSRTHLLKIYAWARKTETRVFHRLGSKHYTYNSNTIKKKVG